MCLRYVHASLILGLGLTVMVVVNVWVIVRAKVRFSRCFSHGKVTIRVSGKVMVCDVGRVRLASTLPTRLTINPNPPN